MWFSLFLLSLFFESVSADCKRSRASFICKGSLTIDEFSVENADAISKFSLKNPDITFGTGQIIDIGELFPNLTRFSVPIRLCGKFCSNFHINGTGSCKTIEKCRVVEREVASESDRLKQSAVHESFHTEQREGAKLLSLTESTEEDVTKKDLNECLTPGICRQYEDCINTPGSFRCETEDCKKGHRLVSSTGLCVDVNECTEQSPCGVGQVCVNTDGSYYCKCPAGYDFDEQTKTCKDIDECSIHPCSPHAQCENIPGSFRCHCMGGFKLAVDGRNCEDIDECAVDGGGCEHNCVNTNSSFYCTCRNGYRLDEDGGSCTIACKVNNGGCDQRCKDLSSGAVQCKCRRGYQLNNDLKSCKVKSTPPAVESTPLAMETTSTTQKSTKKTTPLIKSAYHTSCYVNEWGSWTDCLRTGHGCETPSQAYRIRQVRPEACADSVQRRECFVPCESSSPSTTTQYANFRPEAQRPSFFNTGAGGAAIVVLLLSGIAFIVYIGYFCCKQEPNVVTRDEVMQRNSVEILDFRNNLNSLRQERDQLQIRVDEIQEQNSETTSPTHSEAARLFNDLVSPPLIETTPV